MERVSDSSDALVVEAVAVGRPGRCPDCRKRARRIHSSYQRTLDERPLGSRQVVVRLRVRRYFCDRKSVRAGRSSSRCRASLSGTAGQVSG
ncbi:transposase family protein [Streptomyces avermitilis]|uniref:transposase family protein n=1 Tax=Streptomyces avermitilis TaxID=33903 RepID=UPI0033AFC971